MPSVLDCERLRAHGGKLVGFVLKLVLACAVMHGYLAWRLLFHTRLPRAWSVPLAGILAILFAWTALTIFHAVSPIRSFTPGGYAWLGMSFLLFWSAVLFHVIEVAAAAIRRLRGRALDPARRRTLARMMGGGAAALGLGASAVGAIEARSLTIQRVRVPLARLPAGLDGLRIVQISDLHIGRNIKHDYVAAVVARVNELAPDIVVITGDLVDGTVAVLRSHVAPLADLRAHHGVFFVTGNHEYYIGAKAWCEHLPALGIRVLRNERVAIEGVDGGIDLAGVDDFHADRYRIGHRHDPDAALAGRDPAREVILLAHQPRSVYDAERLGVGLQLSGHTHGGQIFPLRFFLFDQPFIDGLHRLGDTYVYVSRGAGYWGPPMRLGAPPEVAEITLVRA